MLSQASMPFMSMPKALGIYSQNAALELLGLGFEVSDRYNLIQRFGGPSAATKDTEAHTPKLTLKPVQPRKSTANLPPLSRKAPRPNSKQHEITTQGIMPLPAPCACAHGLSAHPCCSSAAEGGGEGGKGNPETRNTQPLDASQKPATQSPELRRGTEIHPCGTPTPQREVPSSRTARAREHQTTKGSKAEALVPESDTS